jgi:hypothetical protein
MTDVTYPAAGGTIPVAKRKSLLARFVDRLTETRMIRARQEIAKHLHLVPAEHRERLRRELAIDAERRA